MTGAASCTRRDGAYAAALAASDRTSSAAIAIHGGIITATQMAVLRTEVSARAAPTTASARSRSSKMATQRRARQYGDRERREADQQRQQHPHRRVGEVRRLPLDDALLALGRPRGGGEDEEVRAVRVDAGGDGGGADGHGEAADAPAGRHGADGPAPLDRLHHDDDRQKSDSGDETGVQVRPEQEERWQQPSPPAAGRAGTTPRSRASSRPARR